LERRKFNLLNSSEAKIFSRGKKPKKKEILIGQLNTLIEDKETERNVIEASLNKHKVKYSRETLTRALKEWRGDK
jgi:hypothetical protein